MYDLDSHLDSNIMDIVNFRKKKMKVLEHEE